MIKETATVIRLESSEAVVEIQRQSVCGHCELSKGCGTGAIGRMLGHRSKLIKISNGGNLKPGDQVVLGIHERAYLKASLLIYGLPLIGLICGGLLSQWFFGESDFNAFVGAATGMGLCLMSSNLITRYRFSHQFNPVILQILAEPKG